MDNNCDYLFVYGSLLNTNNHFGLYVQQHGVTVADGYFNGLLYDMGEYPGAILNLQTDKRVHGIIVKLADTAEALPLLDEYEGYGPDQEQPNLFIRQIVNITTKRAIIPCWVYLYNLPVKGFRLITSGRYQA